jgi:site-specific recombinase XerD
MRTHETTTRELLDLWLMYEQLDIRTDGFNWLVKRAGQKAGLPFQVHAHMLRHSAGYKLAGDGHDTRAI